MVTVVSATIVTKYPEHITRAAEVLARALAGLALEGISVGLNIGQTEDEDEGEDRGTDST
jgi:hypothetical protein